VFGLFWKGRNVKNNPLPRLDANAAVRNALLPFCRLKAGEIWEDSKFGHRVGCLDATSPEQVCYLMGSQTASLAIQDPPYNLIAFAERPLQQFVDWCAQWVRNTERILSADALLYVWLGADQNDGFQPLPDFMMMMRSQPFRSRSFLTMRNQRGYGTQGNWMAVRQELLYYVKGRPVFHVDAEYTDIPKILRGYYKEVRGQITENLEMSQSENIRAGNVWVDVQQVFYRMEENVSGCYAQKPIKSIDRIIRASSNPGETVVDFFAHSGTTLLSAEINRRRCFTMDIDPLFCEIAIRRIEHFRQTGRLGWQNGHPFEDEYVYPAQDAPTKAFSTSSLSTRCDPIKLHRPFAMLMGGKKLELLRVARRPRQRSKP
jgi:site-specific DNA-methyltransferase (adenine-specific)